MRSKIQNVDDLHSEISRLKARRLDYENDFQNISDKIKAKLHIPVLIYHKVGHFVNSLFGVDKDDALKKENTDWVTNIFRVGIPVFLNRYFFPSSGFLMKSVVAMVSQKAAKNVNKDTITDLLDKVTKWIRTPRPKTRKEPVLADYGIPPDSETY